MKNPQSIYFDMQKNTFYRINKKTGESVKSYYNGENIPFFKPNVTGFDHYQRKSAHQPHSDTLKPSPRSKSSLLKEENRNMNNSKEKYKTIDLYNMKEQLYSNTNKNFQSLLKHSRKKLSFTGFTSDFTSTQSIKNEMTKSREKQIKFKSTSKLFERISEQKVRDNHSPIKEIDGIVQRNQIMNTLCLTKSNLTIEDNSSPPKQKQKNSANSRPKHEIKYPSQHEKQEQVKNQRAIFYKFQPQLIFHENEKSLQKQRDRRLNLIKLEKMVIRTNDKKTKEIII